MTRRLLIGFTLAVWLGVGMAYSQEPRPEKPAPTDPATPEDLAADQRHRHPTAEQLLKELRQRRPVTNLLSPVGRGEPDGGQRELLLPEGTAVVERSGWLRRDGDWLTFEFDPSKGETPVRVLPNATLEIMLHAARGSSGPIQFVVSGETTVYAERNYLLIRLARRRASPEAEVGSGFDATDDGQAVLRSARSEASPSGSPTPPPVDDVLSRMKAQEPELELVTRPTLADESGPETGGATQSLLPDGAPLVRRPGRLLLQGRWWTMVFESDHLDHPEPPLKLLPNQNLALMIDAAERDSIGLVFLVSGEVTRFEGANYLLARAAMRRIDPGNLRK